MRNSRIIILTLTTLMTLTSGVKVVSTDLADQAAKDVLGANHEAVQWFIDFNRNHNNTHLAALFDDHDTIYVYPKTHELDLRTLHKNDTAYAGLGRDNLAIMYMPVDRLIDLGVFYRNYVVFDSDNAQDNFQDSLVASANGAVHNERDLEQHLLLHPSAMVKQILSAADKQTISEDVAGLYKRDRNHDCNNPQTYVSGRGDLAQDRDLAAILSLDAGVTGKAFCGKDGKDQQIDSYYMPVLNRCHSTNKRPVAYSMAYDNWSCCPHSPRMWEHHGCRKGTPIDGQIPGGKSVAVNAKTYSWTLVW